jgi:pilus assembly protein CpaC
MSSSNLRDAMRGAAVALLLMLVLAAVALSAETHEKIRIAVGHSAVVTSSEDVRTVAIAEPDIADAAVGSARTVLLTAKAEGSTNLVVYDAAGRYRIYDVEVYVPNGQLQVLLHCTVAELTENAIRELGVDLFGETTQDGHFNGTIGGGLYTSKVEIPTSPLFPGSHTDGIASFTRSDGLLKLQAQWKALEETGDIRLLASPSLLAKSGEKATFLSGGEYPYQVVSGSGLGATVTIVFKEYGVRLEFTPIVQEDGSIRLKVAPEVSEPDYTRSIFGVPPLNSRKASTTVTLNAGEYLVIGGLKDTRSNKVTRKVPILGHIPLLGALFTYQRKESNNKELMVLVSPEIIQPASGVPALPTDKPEKK